LLATKQKKFWHPWPVVGVQTKIFAWTHKKGEGNL